ncbi:peptidase C1 [Candidatus Bathyarchaeota archaeon]|nr:peptidase C1 [Candidatus Bathyarchaeota archaeon]
MSNEKNLQSAIDEKGYKWKHGTTTLSALSNNEKKARLGLKIEKAELDATAKAIQAATSLQTFQAAFSLPAAVDWRNKGGDWTTPIRDQQSCGSCVAFGTVATLEARINIACNNPSLDKDLSEAHLFYCGCGNCCNTGWNFSPALTFCKNTGVGLESSFPYTPGNQPCKAGVTPYIKITGFSTALTISDRKNVLANKGPMVAGMAVYSDFFGYTGGVYRHVSGSLQGYHAICVVGYSDEEECWICKNSWGTGWGDSGWFKIGYGECLIDTSFAFYDVELTCPSPTDPCQKYVPYLKKVLAAAYKNPRLKACLCYYICRTGRRPRVTITDLIITRQVYLILRKCPKYRVPFCRLLRCTSY